MKESVLIRRLKIEVKRNNTKYKKKKRHVNWINCNRYCYLYGISILRSILGVIH